MRILKLKFSRDFPLTLPLSIAVYEKITHLNIDYIRTYILTEKFKTTYKNENLRSIISRIM